MTIHDVRLPVDVERGARGGPGFKTSIITLSNGNEARNQEWERARGAWDVGYGVQSIDTLRTVDAFFRARRGRAYGFRFKDWSDFTATEQFTAAVTGDATKRQLVKSYDDTVNPYVRLIVLPVTDTLTVYVDDFVTTDFTLLPNGILDFDSDPGMNVKATFEFDVPVRFDTDTFVVQLETFMSGAVPSIAIVELRE